MLLIKMFTYVFSDSVNNEYCVLRRLIYLNKGILFKYKTIIFIIFVVLKCYNLN